MEFIQKKWGKPKADPNTEEIIHCGQRKTTYMLLVGRKGLHWDQFFTKRATNRNNKRNRTKEPQAGGFKRGRSSQTDLRHGIRIQPRQWVIIFKSHEITKDKNVPTLRDPTPENQRKCLASIPLNKYKLLLHLTQFIFTELLTTVSSPKHNSTVSPGKEPTYTHTRT